MSTATLEAPSAIIGEVEPPRPFLFDALWDVCPWCGCGTHHDDRKPCPCGSEMFFVVANDKAAEKCRHVCRRCYRQPGWRLARSGDQIVGTYDCVSGEFRSV